ncbi:unnamed protein product [Fusarium equiseti]|uniref:Uncharacterized protein n=1 Tax=Fusarium equiseti TaxID=61235 RepID=A0A8J2J004_FUSEQ|nr:unnamed protein product [Fusarium equiseti]
MAQPPATQKQEIERAAAVSSADNESALACTPEPVYVSQLHRITRQQALDKGGDLINKVREPGVPQWPLRDSMENWLDHHTFLVLPVQLKRDIVWLPENSTDTLTAHLVKPSLDGLKEVIRVLPKSCKQQKLRIKYEMRNLKNIFRFIHHQRESQMQSKQRQMQIEKQQAGLVESLKATSTKLMADLTEQVNRLKVAATRPSPTADPSATPMTTADIEAAVTNVIRREIHYKHHISDEGAQDLKELFAMFRYENIPIPRQLQSVAGEVCSDDQLREVMDRDAMDRE